MDAGPNVATIDKFLAGIDAKFGESMNHFVGQPSTPLNLAAVTEQLVKNLTEANGNDPILRMEDFWVDLREIQADAETISWPQHPYIKCMITVDPDTGHCTVTPA